MEDRWLSVDEIAAYLGVKRDTVYSWISRAGFRAKTYRLTGWDACGSSSGREVDEWVHAGGTAQWRSPRRAKEGKIDG